MHIPSNIDNSAEISVTFIDFAAASSNKTPHCTGYYIAEQLKRAPGTAASSC